MTRRLLPLTLAAAAVLAAGPSLAAHNSGGPIDRFEDRLDRLESIIDEAVDHGPLDVLEDRWDRRESRRDRLGLPTSPRINRIERRSWRRIWGHGH